MTTMYQASIPPMLQYLDAAAAMLGKAATQAEAMKFDGSILVQARLAPTQFTLAKQIQVMSDFAKGGAARLAGVDPAKMADTETTLAELQARLHATIDFLKTLTPAQIDGSEDKVIVLKVAGTERTFKGQDYLLHFVMPNVYFHFTTAYSILRSNGVDVGKRDYMGTVVGMT